MQAENLKQLDLEILPEEARRELLDFYEYLLTRHKKQAKEKIKDILSNPKGILPDDYKFNREEVHER